MDLIELSKPLKHRIPFWGGSITRTLLLQHDKAAKSHEGIPDYKTYLEGIDRVRFQDLGWRQRVFLIFWVGIFCVLGVLTLVFTLILVVILILRKLLPNLQSLPLIKGLANIPLPSFIDLLDSEILNNLVTRKNELGFFENFLLSLHGSLFLIFILIFIGYWFIFIMLPFKIAYTNIMSVCLTEDEKMVLQWLEDPQLPQKLNPKQQKDVRGMYYIFTHFHPGMDVERFYLATEDIFSSWSIACGILSLYFLANAYGDFTLGSNSGLVNLALAILLAIVMAAILWKGFTPYRSLKTQVSSFIKKTIITTSFNLLTNTITNKESKNSLRLQLLHFQLLKKEVEELPWLPVSRYIKIYSFLTLGIPLITLFIL